MWAAIGFDPEIRGVLVVLVGAAVLFGSIFGIVATNVGARLSVLIVGSALFGWIFLMGGVWTIYGIGFVGRAPQWVPLEINYNRDTALSTVPPIQYLPRDNGSQEGGLPEPAELLEKYPLMHAMILGSENVKYEVSTLTKLKTQTQPWIVVSQRNLASVVDRTMATADSNPVLMKHPELRSQLQGSIDELQMKVQEQAAAVRDDIEAPLGGWCLLTESDPRRGEAAAAADNGLIAKKAFGDPTTTSSYLTKDVFIYGGKEPCDPVVEMSMTERVWHRVVTVFEVKNPVMYSAVTVQKAKYFPSVAGQAPPAAQVDTRAETATVGMLRDLGNKRFIPFVVTVIGLLGFIIFGTTLHYRDKAVMEARAAFSGKKG
jgi:hypothetical protein